MASSRELPQRKRPTGGVRIVIDQPTIVFVTVCTNDRVPWLATNECHNLLLNVWSIAQSWRVARYVVMPDHVHFFAFPGNDGSDLESWVKYWKSQFSKTHSDPAKRWQRNQWDTRMRSAVHYAERWEYVRNNPVRHHLVEKTEQWPYQGELYDLQRC